MKNMAIAFDDGGMHNAEFQIELLNKGASWNVNFTATAVGARWDENYELTNGYNNVNVSLPGAFWGDYIADYDLINDPIAGENPILALGLYKISAIEGGQVKSYFYMDWRTCGFYGSADVRLKYDYATKHFRNISNTQTIDRTYQTVWDLNIEVELETNELEDYWANCLALIPAVSNQPRLIWGPYPELVDMAGYLVYRKLGGGNFTLLYTTPNENTFSYTDPDYSIDYGGTQLEYYIKAYYSSRELSPASNTVLTSGIILLKQPAEEMNYQLSQNYPNPFNPTTTISWQSPTDNFVTLKVFDMLGREVSTLVNEYQLAGNHSIIFDASNLSSGVYIYKLQVGKFSSIRKLVLQK